MAYELIKAQKEVDGWGYIYKEVEKDIAAILFEIVQGELDWTDYLFEGRSLVGLTADLLKGCTLHYAHIVYSALGITNPFEVVKENPCTYMKKWVDGATMQHAPQEIQHGAYRQGSIDDDVSSIDDLDFEI